MGFRSGSLRVLEFQAHSLAQGGPRAGPLDAPSQSPSLPPGAADLQCGPGAPLRPALTCASLPVAARSWPSRSRTSVAAPAMAVLAL